MRRLSLLAVLMAAAVGGPALAQQTPSLETTRTKPALTDDDLRIVLDWVRFYVNQIVTNTDTDRRGMVAARDIILSEVRGTGASPAFRQALGERIVTAVKESDKKALSQEARANLFVLVAEARSLDGIPLLIAALERDPYPASRYWAARGLNMAADVVLEKMNPRMEQDMSAAAGKAFDVDLPTPVAFVLLEMLGKFDHEAAHDALADAVIKYVQRAPASDPIVAQTFIAAVPAMEKAYAKEVRPEGKTRVMTAYAWLCAWLTLPAADPALATNLNASLEKITGEKIGFPVSGDPVAEKLALVEWAEKLVRDKKVPKRPALPPAVEETVRELRSTLPGGAAP
ncbi:MAG: hypothetical protein FJ288_06575 [Planctomycetes bacterium]|nr:hypothetical protein [Planctomycetota bacterium]